MQVDFVTEEIYPFSGNWFPISQSVCCHDR